MKNSYICLCRWLSRYPCYLPYWIIDTLSQQGQIPKDRQDVLSSKQDLSCGMPTCIFIYKPAKNRSLARGHPDRGPSHREEFSAVSCDISQMPSGKGKLGYGEHHGPHCAPQPNVQSLHRTRLRRPTKRQRQSVTTDAGLPSKSFHHAVLHCLLSDFAWLSFSSI